MAGRCFLGIASTSLAGAGRGGRDHHPLGGEGGLSVDFIIDEDTGLTPMTVVWGAPHPAVSVVIARRLTQRRPTKPPSSAPDLQPPFMIFVVVFQLRRRCIDADDTIRQRHRIDAAAANATQKRWPSDPGGNLIKKLTLQR